MSYYKSEDETAETSKYLGQKVLEYGENGEPRVGIVKELYCSEKDDKSFRWVIKFEDDPKSTTTMDEEDIIVALEEYEAYKEHSVTNTTSSEQNSNNSNNSHDNNSNTKESVDKNSGKKKKYFIYII